MTREQAILEDVSRIAGVRSALLVSADDGLVVAESALDDQPTEAAAASRRRAAPSQRRPIARRAASERGTMYWGYRRQSA